MFFEQKYPSSMIHPVLWHDKGDNIDMCHKGM